MTEKSAIKKLLFAFVFFVGTAAAALAQSSPGLIYGQVPTPAQWNSYFQAKQDVLGYTPLNIAGGTMQGPLFTTASTATQAGLRVPPGIAPSSPINGDFWSTSAGFFGQANGVTYGPFTEGTSGSFTGSSPIVVSFPGGGVVNYAFDFTVANTFLAQQFDQGATTTSPGWYAQLTGDTQARVRVGLNATDIPSIALGPGGSTPRDAFIERVGAGALRFGAPDAAAPVAQSLSVQNVVAGTSNTAGANVTINGSQGTGTGLGGSIIFQVAPAGLTGTAQNALAAALTLDSTKLATFAGHLAVEGVTSTGATGTGKFVFNTSPTLTTPNINVAAGTSLAIGGCTIGSNVLCVTGATALGNTVIGAGSAITSSGPGGALTAVAYASFGTGSGNAAQGGVITAGGPTGSATVAPIITYNAAGQLTTVSSATITPAIGSVTGLGTGIATALGVNVGTAGAPVILGGALGSPSSAGTIPAFTLGGTIAGGGNQINNVIIGASTPLAGSFTTAAVSTSVTSPLHIGGSAANSSLTLQSTSGAGTSDSIIFQTGSQATRWTIDSAGDLSHGTTDICSTYSVTSCIGLQAAANSGIFWGQDSTHFIQFLWNYNATAGSASAALAAFGYNNPLTIDASTVTIQGGSTGATVIGGTFAVAGMTNVATTSAVCFNTSTHLLTYDGTIGTCTTSDERLKNMGQRIPNALERLLQIKGVYYTWKDPKYGTGRQIGLGAQTVEKVFPELVQTGSDGYKSLDYQRLTAPIIEALRELKADNDNLRREIAHLRRVK